MVMNQVQITNNGVNFPENTFLNKAQMREVYFKMLGVRFSPIKDLEADINDFTGFHIDVDLPSDICKVEKTIGLLMFRKIIDHINNKMNTIKFKYPEGDQNAINADSSSMD